MLDLKRREFSVEFVNHSQGEPIGSPLVRLLLTKGMIAADFLGDPTGTRVGHAIWRCPGEVETSNASDPLQEDRVALQTVVSAMVRSWS